MGCTVEGSEFESRGGKIFLLSTAFRAAPEPTQPPIQRASSALSPGVKGPGLEANQSPPTSAELKNACIYTATPAYIFMA
jgi:hypothetical protein